VETETFRSIHRGFPLPDEAALYVDSARDDIMVSQQADSGMSSEQWFALLMIGLSVLIFLVVRQSERSG
jgi:hypothetical protein